MSLERYCRGTLFIFFGCLFLGLCLCLHTHTHTRYLGFLSILRVKFIFKFQEYVRSMRLCPDAIVSQSVSQHRTSYSTSVKNIKLPKFSAFSFYCLSVYPFIHLNRFLLKLITSVNKMGKIQ